jgi:hypothetical protein
MHARMATHHGCINTNTVCASIPTQPAQAELSQSNSTSCSKAARNFRMASTHSRDEAIYTHSASMCLACSVQMPKGCGTYLKRETRTGNQCAQCFTDHRQHKAHRRVSAQPNVTQPRYEHTQQVYSARHVMQTASTLNTQSKRTPEYTLQKAHQHTVSRMHPINTDSTSTLLSTQCKHPRQLAGVYGVVQT